MPIRPGRWSPVSISLRAFPNVIALLARWLAPLQGWRSPGALCSILSPIVELVTPLADFMRGRKAYFTTSGCIVDQPFQPRLPDGMIRCYIGVDQAIGFGHQFIKARIPPPPDGPDSEAAQPGLRVMHSVAAPAVPSHQGKDGIGVDASADAIA